MGWITVLDSNGDPQQIPDGGLIDVGDYTRQSLTATTTAANIVSANPNRQSFNFCNNSSSVAVWACEGATAVVGSAGQRVPPGATFVTETRDFVSVISESGSVFCSGIEV